MKIEIYELNYINLKSTETVPYRIKTVLYKNGYTETTILKQTISIENNIEYIFVTDQIYSGFNLTTDEAIEKLNSTLESQGALFKYEKGIELLKTETLEV